MFVSITNSTHGVLLVRAHTSSRARPGSYIHFFVSQLIFIGRQRVNLPQTSVDSRFCACDVTDCADLSIKWEILACSKINVLALFMWLRINRKKTLLEQEK